MVKIGGAKTDLQGGRATQPPQPLQNKPLIWDAKFLQVNFFFAPVFMMLKGDIATNLVGFTETWFILFEYYDRMV